MKSIEITSDLEGITKIALSTNEYKIIEGKSKGTLNRLYSTKSSVSFSEDEQLIGFYGTNRMNIESVGFISFKTSCVIEAEEVDVPYENITEVEIDEEE